ALALCAALWRRVNATGGSGGIGLGSLVSMANSKSRLKTSLPLPSVTLLLHVTPRRFRPNSSIRHRQVGGGSRPYPVLLLQRWWIGPGSSHCRRIPPSHRRSSAECSCPRDEICAHTPPAGC